MKVEGQLVFNMLSSVLRAALDGFGLAYLPHDQAKDRLDDASLVEILTGRRQTFEDYHLYYPPRRHSSPAFSLLVEALRWRTQRSVRPSAPKGSRSLSKPAPCLASPVCLPARCLATAPRRARRQAFW